MRHQLLKLAYIRKRDRKSLLFVISILLFSSFCDEIFLSVKQMGTMKGNAIDLVTLDNLSVNKDLSSEAKLNPQSLDYQQKAEIQPLDTNDSENFKDSKKEEKPKVKASASARKVSKSSYSGKQDSITRLPSKPLMNLAKIEIDANNPNVDDLAALGIPKKVAYTWLKYTNAGGTILQKEDLEKIYGMEKEHVERLDQHILFPQKLKFKSKAQLTSIYLNKATSYDFSKVPGIGPILSERIVKFREKLGGFHSIEQLKDVYGIEPELIKNYENLFVIEEPVIKININTCNEQQLGAHSYCSYRIAKAIINYRSQHGNFTSSSDLRPIRIIEEDWIEKISPYLSF